MRPDGSCNHILIFDPATGEFVDNPAGQGYGRGSSWSRGQAWAVYGFTLSYLHTGDQTFLDTAKQCAQYVIANLAVGDWLPLVDYRAPAEPVKYDSTAGMITAAGLLELARHVGPYERPLYGKAALRILRACEKRFANWDLRWIPSWTAALIFITTPMGPTRKYRSSMGIIIWWKRCFVFWIKIFCFGSLQSRGVLKKIKEER